MQFVVTLCLPLLFAVSAFGQTPSTTVTGVVVDAGTRAPIPAAVVAADGRYVAADANGGFVLTLPRGRITIEVVAPGYFTLVTTLEVGAAEVKDAELALAKDDGFASSVDVVAPAPTVARPRKQWRLSRSCARRAPSTTSSVRYKSFPASQRQRIR